MSSPRLKTIQNMTVRSNTAVNKDAQVAGFASFLGACYLRR